MISPGIIAFIFGVEAVFIVVKKPYALGSWKRPFFNKVIAVLVALLYVGASIFEDDSLISQVIPLIILLLLISVLVVGAISAINEIKEYWSTRE